MLKRLARLTGFLGVVVAFVPLYAVQQPAPNEFVPMDSLPPAEQLPSAPLLVAAYIFVWLAAMFYMWTIWRRLGKVEEDMRALERRRGAGSRR